MKFKNSSRLRILLHTLGLSCLGGTLFLQILVFADILFYGRFIAIENNPIVLTFEITLTTYAIGYFAYLYRKFLIQARIEWEFSSRKKFKN